MHMRQDHACSCHCAMYQSTWLSYQRANEHMTSYAFTTATAQQDIIWSGPQTLSTVHTTGGPAEGLDIIMARVVSRAFSKFILQLRDKIWE